nr:TerC family protein [Paenibacillus sp. MSJ-34]
MSVENIWLLLEILIINMVLSGDNAVVIALAGKNLPPKQRKLAVWWGAFGAVAMRSILTVAALFLLKIPYIQAIGSLLLLYIAVKLLIDEENYTKVRESSSLWSAVWTIMVADFVMSLDNVLAIAAIARGDFALIVIGIALSIPIVVWGSGIIMKLLHRFPVLVYIGAAILGYTSGEMLMNDAKLESLFSGWAPAHAYVPIVLAVLVIVIGIVKKYRSSVHS